VVVKRKEDGADYGPVSVTIAECKAGAPPVRSAVAWEGTPFAYSKTIDPSIHVRDGDIIHGRIELRQPPKVILVSSSGKGIVTLDKYGFNALGPTAGIDDVVLHSMDGKVRHRKNRSELFDEKARGGFRHIDGATSWLRACWLDEMRNELVLVAVTRSVKPTTRPLLTMNLTTGAVRAGGTEWIDRAILEHSALSLSEALDLAKELRLAESQAAWPTLLRDDKLSLYVRVQVALLLVSFNDQRGVDVIMNAALDKPGTRDGGAQYLAVTILPEVFGDEAAPNLCEYVRRFGKEDSHPAWSAMRSVPAKAAVPALRRLLDRKEPVHCQLFALE
jgi:hypothetical protein